MSAVVGSLNIGATVDTAGFSKGLTKMQQQLAASQKKFQSIGAGMASIGKTMTLGLTAPLAGFAAKGIAEARETAAAMAQVNAALASMGPVAGKTAGHLEAAANAFEGKSLFEADQILKDVTARLLGFGNVTGATFDRAQQAIIDYSQRTGKDLSASTVLIGKALNNPAKAMGVLTKAGVSLTDNQKTLLAQFNETGNVAGAQGVILDGLAKGYRGAAQAAQDADPWNRLTDAFKSMAESVGKLLLPVIPPLADALSGVAKWFTDLDPVTQKWVAGIGAVALAAGPTLIVLGSLVSALGKIGPAVTALSAAWGVLKGAFLAARLAALTTLPALVPFLVPLAAIAAAVGVAYLAWKNWDKIKAIVGNMVKGVTGWLSKLTAPFKWVADQAKQVGDAFFRLYDRVVRRSYIPDMVAGIATEIAKLNAVMVEPVKHATEKAAAAFQTMRDKVQPLTELLANLYPESVKQNEFLAGLETLDKALAEGRLKADQYADALGRLVSRDYSEAMQNGAMAAVGMASPGAVANDNTSVSDATTNLPQIVDWTEQWGKVLSENVGGALRSITAGLGAAAVGQAKLADVGIETMKRLTAALVEYAAQMAILAGIKSIFGADSGPAKFVGKAFGLASGGFIRGPGTGRSDSIPAMLSNGEFVVNAKATKQFLPLLSRINALEFSRFSTGGLAMPSMPMSSALMINDSDLRSMASARPQQAFTINVVAPNTGNPRADRQSSMQHASIIRDQIARSAKGGY